MPIPHDMQVIEIARPGAPEVLTLALSLIHI